MALDLAKIGSWERDLASGELIADTICKAHPGPVLLLTRDLALSEANARWMELSGLTLEESRERGWQSAVHPDDLGRLPTLDGAQNSSPSWPAEIRLGSPGGAYRRVPIQAAPLRNAAGELTGWCVTSPVHPFQTAPSITMQAAE